MGGCDRTGQCRLVALPRPLPASWREATTSNILSRGLVAAAKPVPAAASWRSSYYVLSVDQQFSGLAGLSAGIQAEPDGNVAARIWFRRHPWQTWGAVRLNESAVYVLSRTQRQPPTVSAQAGAQAKASFFTTDCHPKGNIMLHRAPALAQVQSHQPKTTSALLRQLGIQHASALYQRRALAEWLESNTATSELKLSLRANGYGIFLLPRPLRRSPQTLNPNVVPRAS